jgi:hypothetical protein
MVLIWQPAMSILTGLMLTILPAPVGPAPDWLKALAGPLSFLPLSAVALSWWMITRTPWYKQLIAVGSDNRTAYTTGVPVTAVQLLAYVLSGVYTGAAALMLTTLIGSADPNVGPTYILIAIFTVALGGVSLTGRRGGLLGAAIGALDIFLPYFLDICNFALLHEPCQFNHIWPRESPLSSTLATTLHVKARGWPIIRRRWDICLWHRWRLLTSLG